MKRSLWLLVLTLVVVAALLLTGCGQPAAPQEPDPEAGIRWGQLSLTDQEAAGLAPNREIILGQMTNREKNVSMENFDTLTAMLLALQGGQIDLFVVPYYTGLYLEQQDLGLSAVFSTTEVGYAMATLADRPAWRNMLDEGITVLRDDGTIDELVQRYITEPQEGDSMTAADLPRFDGAETLRIAVTGDMPPMDYIAADGEPSGFNVALCTALSNYMEVNIELVPLDSGARLTALAAGTVDALFWMSTYDEDVQYESLLLTSPYFHDVNCGVMYTERVEEITSTIGYTQ